MNAQQKIAVAGATGRVGTHIVELLESSGHEVVSISRSNGVDVISGVGLQDALAGVNTVIDAATGPSPDQARKFFLTAARNLQDAGGQAGVGRIVLVSIIGCDRFSGTVQEASNPGDLDSELLAGDGLLPGPHAKLSGPTFAQWLESQVALARGAA